MAEKNIENAVVKYARDQGALVYKFTAPGTRNVPDRLFLFQGRAYFIEFKNTGKIARPSQVREAGKIQQQGFDVHFVDNTAEGKRIIDSYA